MTEDNSTPDKFINRRENVNNEKLDSDDSCKLDLGVDLSRNFNRNMNVEDAAAGCNVNETMKKEENPFSFKHFLYNDIPIYHTQGARPKVYCDGRPISSVSDLDLHNPPNMKQTRMVPEFSSALPDFVQDHLVVEQCYLNSEDASRHNFNVDSIPNLPDFTPNNRSNITYDSQNEDSISSGIRANQGSANPSSTLNLSTKPLADFPLDLPIDSHSIESRNCSNSVDVTVSKSLPDFLTDGAVRTQESEVEQAGSSPESEISRLRQENKLFRQQCIEQSRRCEMLQRQVDSSGSKEQEYIQNLTKALEQVEYRLEDSNKRTSAAETMIIKLRQEIKSSKNEISKLQYENRILQREQGAAGGPSAKTYIDMHSHKVVKELRSSADTAEHSLRQLLIGVDNLRIIASTIENFNRIEENKETFSDCEDDAGPAL